MRRQRCETRHQPQERATVALLTSHRFAMGPSSPPEGGEEKRALPQLADRFRLTAYDAAYLELAQRRKLPLATLDQRLHTA